MNTLGEILKSKREERGLSLREVSKITGLSHAYIKILEKGEDPNTKMTTSPTIITLLKLSDFLGMPLPKLLEITGYIKSSEEINKDYNDESLREFYGLAKKIGYKELKAAEEMIQRGLSLVEINRALKVSPKNDN